MLEVWPLELELRSISRDWNRPGVANVCAPSDPVCTIVSLSADPTHAATPTQTPPRVTVVSNIAVIDTLGPQGLPEALAAIPGTPLRSGDAAWALKLGPERAASLQRVAGAFDLDLDSESEATLSALATQRDPGDPPIEVICDCEGDWLSLSDDCASLGTEALKAIPGTRSVSAAGRVEVPIATWTRDSIREIVDTYALRLSPAARRALDGSPAPETQEADRSASPGPATDEPASIRLDASGTLLEVHTGGRAELSLAFAGVPSARSWGAGGGGWLLSANRETARAVGSVLQTHDVDVDDRATRWLEEALRWIARFDVDGGASAPRIEITTRWGEPTSLEGVTDLTSTSAGHCAPLSPANLRHLARARRRGARSHELARSSTSAPTGSSAIRTRPRFHPQSSTWPRRA